MKEDKDTNLFDLLILFSRWIGRCIRHMFTGIGWCLQLSAHYIPLTIIVCAIGLALGFYFSQPERRYYNVEGLAILNGPSASITKEISRPLEWAFPHTLHNQQNFITKCGISSEAASSIKRMETFYVIDNLNDSTPDHIDFKHKHDLTDTLNVRMQNYLYFRFRTKRIDKVSEIEEGLLRYFNNHPTMVEWNKLRRQNLQDAVNMYNQQILYLDSLSKKAYLDDPVHAKLTLHNNSLIIGEQKKQYFHEEITILQNQRQGKEIELVCDSVPMYFPAHLAVNPRAINGRIKTLAIAAIVSYILSLLLASGWKYRRDIREFLLRK